jgi:DNA-3-methyladenine glycosylase
MLRSTPGLSKMARACGLPTMTIRSTERLLPRAFYARDTVVVARALLGQRLVRVLNGQRLSGLICEIEAYGGADDPASHAYRRTQRSAIMFGPPGMAYVYFIYGMHHCLNAVTASDGHPGALLIRGIFPAEGIETMRTRRPGVADRHLADGPAKLCQALGIALAQNGSDLTVDSELFIVAGEQVAAQEITTTPRIGVRGDEEARTRPWRFVWQQAHDPTEPVLRDETSAKALV